MVLYLVPEFLNLSSWGGCGSGSRAGCPLITGLAVWSPPPPAQMLRCTWTDRNLLLMARPTLCVVALCHWCVNVCTNKQQKPCKAFWIKVLYKCSHLPFTSSWLYLCFHINEKQEITNFMTIHLVVIEIFHSKQNLLGSIMPLGFILWEPWLSAQNFMTIHLTVVEIFQSEPKWWTNWRTERLWHPWSHTTVAKKGVTDIRAGGKLFKPALFSQ